MFEKQFSTNFPLKMMSSSRFSPRYAHSFETIIRNYNAFVIESIFFNNFKTHKSENPSFFHSECVLSKQKRPITKQSDASFNQSQARFQSAALAEFCEIDIVK